MLSPSSGSFCLLSRPRAQRTESLLTLEAGWGQNSPLKHCNIGQVSAYTCKLHELPPGTSRWSSSLCTIKGRAQSHKIFVSQKQYPKSHQLAQEVQHASRCPSEKYPMEVFFSETFSINGSWDIPPTKPQDPRIFSCMVY